MHIIEIELATPSYFRKAKARFNFTTAYDSETNKTTVNFGSCVFSAQLPSARFLGVSASITVAAADNTDSFATSSISSKKFAMASLSEVPIPKTVTVQHGFGNVEKYITVSISVTLDLSAPNGSYKAHGHVTRTIYVGLDSIVHVGDKVGSLYVFKGDKWHIGMIHAGSGGKWNIGIGHILSGVIATHDGAGNVYLENVTVLYDGNGGITMNGVTAADDDNGNVTVS